MSIRVKLVLHERSNICIYFTFSYSALNVADLYQMIRPLGGNVLKGIARQCGFPSNKEISLFTR